MQGGSTAPAKDRHGRLERPRLRKGGTHSCRRIVPPDMQGVRVDCVSPPCGGVVTESICSKCGLKQWDTPEGRLIEGPMRVVWRQSTHEELWDIAESATIGDELAALTRTASGVAARAFLSKELV